ncbi:MAG: hypothetical protein ABSE73_11660 [Planctomycetota bacterium]
MCDNARMASLWSNRNFGGTRDAVLVYGLATLAGCASIVLAHTLRPEDEAFAPGLGVALSATGVLLVWSLTLAVRAWRRGERSAWCWAVMVVGGPETVLLGVIAYFIRVVFPFSSLFDWVYETGLIVFLPVGAIAYLVAVTVAWWRVRRAARQIRGHDPISGCLEIGIVSPDLHWKRGLICCCALAGLLVVLLLPGPLFLYCAHWDRQNSDRSWRTWIKEHTPVFVADPAAVAARALESFYYDDFLPWITPHEPTSLLSSSFGPRRPCLYYCALCSGRVSKNRLLAELNSTNYEAVEAFYGLKLADPQAALALADEIGQGRFSATSFGLGEQAGELMGGQGTTERIRYFLAQAATQSPPNADFVDGVLWGLGHRVEFLPELISFCRQDYPNRRAALMALVDMLPPKDLPGVLAEFLADRDPARRKQTLETFRFIPDANARLAMVAAGFESRDPAVRQEMQSALTLPYLNVFSLGEPIDPALMKRLVRTFLQVLDDADRSTRCAAAYSLSYLVDNNGTYLALRKEYGFFNSWFVRLDHGEPVGPPAEEQEMVESVRAAARKWLDEHK